MAFRETVSKDQVNPVVFRGVQQYPRGVPVNNKGRNGRSIPSLPDVVVRTHTVCTEKTKAGKPCAAKPNAVSGLCFSHGRKVSENND